MNILKIIEASIDRRDEKANIELAHKIVKAKDEQAVKDLVHLLQHKEKAFRYDAVKALYEIGYIMPKYLCPYLKEFLPLLKNKDNRMQWGAMTAISAISVVQAEKIYPYMVNILESADSGSVITRDHAVKCLVNIGRIKKYQQEVMPLLMNILLTAPENQFPSYAEQTFEIIKEEDKKEFKKILQQRVKELGTESKQKRVNKILLKIK